MNIPPEITRIDLERAGGGLFVRQWKLGWRDDGSSCHESEEYVTGQRIEALLAECEKLGFAVWMCDNSHGRALRGDVTRIDFVEGKIRKYPYGWTAKTRPLSERTATPDEIQAAVQWCKEHNWTVREWPNGARAWKGEPKPIRDASTIRYLRRQTDASLGDPRRRYDLAFDF